MGEDKRNRFAALADSQAGLEALERAAVSSPGDAPLQAQTRAVRGVIGALRATN